MKKKIAFFHTTLNTPLPLKTAFEARYPGVQLITVVDDSVLPEVIENNDCFTPGIVRRLVSFGGNVQAQGAAAAVCMCTTLTGAVKQAALAMDIPFLTIDGPMLHEAVTKGDRIALLITAKTTFHASSEAIRAAAVEAGRDQVHIDTILVEGAFEALNRKHDKALHDELIAEAAKKAARDHDVIVLAQVSMVDAAQQLESLTIPVLTSLDSGMEQLAAYLAESEESL